MQNRAPVPRAARPALPDFAPVPRKYRHDGWTPERQRAFIEALADTGSVTRAAGMVNMAQANCYALRRAPGADEFRRAWEAALDFGVQRLKDIAFERAIEGELIPVFVAGKLMGFRRKFDNRLLTFMLRQYGGDEGGKRTTINYVSAKATAGVASAGTASNDAGGAAIAAAEVGTTTVRTVITGDGGADGATRALRDDRLAGELNGFAGVALDPEAEAAINVALEACAARARAADDAIAGGGDAAADVLADDPGEPFVRVDETGDPYRGALIPPVELDGGAEDWAEDGAGDARFVAGEPDWRQAGADELQVNMPPAYSGSSGGRSDLQLGWRSKRRWPASSGRRRSRAGASRRVLAMPGAAQARW